MGLRRNDRILVYLRSPKDIIPFESQGIYEIPCGVCDRTYIGKINRHISIRVNEHKNMFKHRDLNSALFTQSHNTGHWIHFSHTKTIASLDKESHCVFREAIEIEKRPSSDAKNSQETCKSIILNSTQLVTQIIPQRSQFTPSYDHVQ